MDKVIRYFKGYVTYIKEESVHSPEGRLSQLQRARKCGTKRLDWTVDPDLKWEILDEKAATAWRDAHNKEAVKADIKMKADAKKSVKKVEKDNAAALKEFRAKITGKKEVKKENDGK